MSVILALIQTENILNSIIPIAVGGITSIWFSLYLCLRKYKERSTISEILGRITMHPIAAFPILITILWVVYKLVGEFGAGTCVDFFENKVFGRSSTPSGGFDIYIYIPFIKKIFNITHINFQGFNYYCGLFAQKIISKDNI